MLFSIRSIITMCRQILLSGLTSMLISTVACADIYGYIDTDGSAHFSTEKLDSRYQLFMHNDATFDASIVMSDTNTGAALPNNPLLRYLAQHPHLKKYEKMVNQAAQEFSLEPALLNAVMAAESGFNPSAISPKGAIGLMQIMPATAERYGLTSDHIKPVQEKLTDPRTNIRLGARYLRDLMKLYPHQQELVIASYNAGESAVQKYKNQIPPFPETRNYVTLVRQFYQLYKPTLPPTTDTDTKSPRMHMTIPGRKGMPVID